MNKKEVTEIKKLFTKERCCLNRLCGCYVDADKNKVVQFKEAFLSLPEEEIYKYLDIFRKSLSGTLGKNLPAGTGNGGWHTEKSAGAAGQ